MAIHPVIASTKLTANLSNTPVLKTNVCAIVLRITRLTEDLHYRRELTEICTENRIFRAHISYFPFHCFALDLACFASLSVDFFVFR